MTCNSRQSAPAPRWRQLRLATPVPQLSLTPGYRAWEVGPPASGSALVSVTPSVTGEQTGQPASPACDAVVLRLPSGVDWSVGTSERLLVMPAVGELIEKHLQSNPLDCIGDLRLFLSVDEAASLLRSGEIQDYIKQMPAQIRLVEHPLLPSGFPPRLYGLEVVIGSAVTRAD
jgi:hypothetical protein